MNSSDVSERPRIEEKTDNEEGYPIPGYEVIVLNWFEQLRSTISVDELIELEDV